MEFPEIIKEILDLAVHAPSGDNSQPWKFIVKNQVVSIFNIQDRDETLYNFRQRGSYLSHGALIENIVLTGENYGYQAAVVILPDPLNPTCTAKMTFSPLPAKKSTLAGYINQRSTNRKPYSKKPLLPEHLALIQKNKEIDYGNCNLTIIENRKEIDQLGKTISLNEKLLIENKSIHDVLFSMIRWSAEEEKEKPGLYIKTFELPPPAQLIFKLIKSWKWSSCLASIGFGSFLASQSAKTHSSCSAIGIIHMPTDDATDFIRAGRLLQKIWLIATRAGISMQPITAIPYLAQRIGYNETSGLSPLQIEALIEADASIRSIAKLKNKEVIAMIFRIGYGKPPSAPAHKMPAIISFEK